VRRGRRCCCVARFLCLHAVVVGFELTAGGHDIPPSYTTNRQSVLRCGGGEQMLQRDGAGRRTGPSNGGEEAVVLGEGLVEGDDLVVG
jgi:hypothetical protein